MTPIRSGEIGTPQRIVTVPEPVPFVLPTFQPSAPIDVPQPVENPVAPAVPA